MLLFGKAPKSITGEDILRLIDSSIPESKTLEYKRELKLETDDEKKEFLADIISMTNSEGGVIIYGIEEKVDEKKKPTGLPNTIIGINLPNKDQFILRIEDIIRSNTDPKMNVFEPAFIEVNGVEVLLIGTRKFTSVPHMITYKGSNKFWIRGNKGKYMADTNALNNLFMRNYLQKERIASFIDGRINEVLSGDVFQTLKTDRSFFLHIIPVNYFEEEILPVSKLENMDVIRNNINFFQKRAWDKGYNLDGYLNLALSGDSMIESYIQYFRDGCIEYYTARFFNQKIDSDISYINGIEIEKKIETSVKTAIDIYMLNNIEGPYIINVSLFNVCGCRLINQSNLNYLYMSDYNIIERNILKLPRVLIQSNAAQLPKDLKFLFDIFWQSGGYPKSPSFTDDLGDG